MAFIPLPFIVLDQNALSRHAVLQPAIEKARSDGSKLMLTDAAFIELVKGDDWEARLKGGFARLEPVRHLVTVARPVPELLRRELATGMPAVDDLEAADYGTSTRKLIREVLAGKGAGLDHMRARIDDAKGRILPQYLDGLANKKQLLAYVDAFNERLDNAERAQLADPAYRRATLANERWAQFLCEHVRAFGVDYPDPLGRQPSVISQILFAVVLIAARWYRNSGITHASPDKITNDLIDAEYAITASFCRGFASQDRNAVALREDLAEIVKLRA